MEKQSWISKHVDTCIIIGSIASALIWNNSQFNELTREISQVKQDVAIIKTVLIMKNICPNELASNEKEIK